MQQKKRLLFFVTEDWYFSLHFLHFAEYAIKLGWEVCLFCNTGQKGQYPLQQIQDACVKVFPLSLSRSGIKPLDDLKIFFKLLNFTKRWKPAVMHAVALKPIFICDLISRLTRVPTIAMLTGLGFVYTSDSLKARILRPLISKLLQWSWKSKWNKFVVLNDEDSSWAQQNFGISSEAVFVLPGVGIDTDKFSPKPVFEGEFSLAYVGRILKDKGIYELIKAIEIVKDRGGKVRLVLIGAPDQSNSASISNRQIEEWVKNGYCEFWGHISDVAGALSKFHAVILPSYREGMPTSILEAASSGLPCIATNVPGCRSAVIDGETGLLVPPRNSEELARAIERLAQNPMLREKMGTKAREMVVEKFSREKILTLMMRIYDSYL